MKKDGNKIKKKKKTIREKKKTRKIISEVE